jgi:transcriptional regulator with XRE-family HTH domain
LTTAPRPGIDFEGLIRKHAEATGYTVWQLFTQAGVSYSNWSRWLNGETTPTVRVLEQLLAVRPKPGEEGGAA